MKGTYEINSFVLIAWSLVCLPAWLLDEGDSIFIFFVLPFNLAFGILPRSCVMVEVTTGRAFFRKLRSVSDLISLCSTFSDEEFGGLGTRRLGPVEWSVILASSWHITMGLLRFFGKSCSLWLLLHVRFDWDEVSYWCFRIVTGETEGGYLQHAVHYLPHCDLMVHLVPGCIRWICPCVILLPDYFQVLL